jgi:hypothetical protein
MFLLTRIRRMLADPPEEPHTHALNTALNAHWKSLFDVEVKLSDKLRRNFAEMQRCAQIAEEKHLVFVAAELALWEAKRAAFQLEATLGGLPGQPGSLQSADWGTHWILFHWTEPATGGPVWGYRLERRAGRQPFYVADLGVEPEITLVNQPQGRVMHYRVVPFNGWGDGPPSAEFKIKFDPELREKGKRRKKKAASGDQAAAQPGKDEKGSAREPGGDEPSGD